MAYYKVRIEVWCDWNPGESDLEEIVENTSDFGTLIWPHFGRLLRNTSAWD